MARASVPRIYEAILEQAETATCAEYPKSSKGKRSQSEDVSGSSKDGPRRWAKTNLVEEKEEGIPFRRISVGKGDAAWWETPRRAAW